MLVQIIFVLALILIVGALIYGVIYMFSGCSGIADYAAILAAIVGGLLFFHFCVVNKDKDALVLDSSEMECYEVSGKTLATCVYHSSYPSYSSKSSDIFIITNKNNSFIWKYFKEDNDFKFLTNWVIFKHWGIFKNNNSNHISNYESNNMYIQFMAGSNNVRIEKINKGERVVYILVPESQGANSILYVYKCKVR